MITILFNTFGERVVVGGAFMDAVIHDDVPVSHAGNY